ncbi:MAG TPA: VanW family protein [Syntrophomonas sp.]|nr:VanW family protein [Syntrophomonas sp.]
MNKKFYTSRLVQIALILLVALAVLALLFINQYYLSDDFRPGAAIAGMTVAGSDREEAENLLAQQLEGINDISVTFAYQGSEDRTNLGALIKPLNMEMMVASAWAKDRSQSWYHIVANIVMQRTVNYPLLLEYNSAATDDLLRKWNAKWAVPFHDAVLEMDKSKGLIVTPGQIGMKVDKIATFKILPTEMEYIPDGISGDIVMEKQYPKVDEKTLSHMGEITHYVTRYNANELNRTHNLTKAAIGINGSIILPGEVFSFNRTVGQRTMETGYKDAMVIVNGKFEPGLGGGICQVSSTLYNACLLAGLEIVERHNHNLTVAYVPIGQDATVSYGTQDFKFKNNTTSPVYVRVVAVGGYLTVTIYGDTNFKQKIEISNIIDQSTPFETVTLADKTLQPGESKLDHNGQNGFVVRSFRIFYDSNGEKTKSESLGRSVYRPLNKTILAGPTAEEKPATEGETTVEEEPPAASDVPKPNTSEGTTDPAPTENQEQETANQQETVIE